ncbi:GtrA family protein [Pseudomonas sp. CDFA 553]|uniref:GtrA family protein n=1 Tax=Pseudomonas quasicaspiana TaxID=2829821 RepID=UPI0022286963|nr:GtrA family protein [Pseudomonas quasicaspiana]MCD5989346.1 GtrA family protein [Pseudomonas quasicaspiana]
MTNANHKLKSPGLSKALRFAVTGLFITLLHIAVAMLMVEVLIASPSVANGVAFGVSALTSYMINTLWSFSARLQGYTLIRFICVSLIGFAVSMLIARLAQQVGLDYRIGIAGVVFIVPVLTFLLHSKWTYR